MNSFFLCGPNEGAKFGFSDAPTVGIMSTKSTSPISIDPAEISRLAEKMIAVPDQLAAIRVDLQALCLAGDPSISAERRRTILDACERLHESVATLTEVVKGINALLGLGPGERPRI
jgi:hypothetical protein